MSARHIKQNFCVNLTFFVDNIVTWRSRKLVWYSVFLCFYLLLYLINCLLNFIVLNTHNHCMFVYFVACFSKLFALYASTATTTWHRHKALLCLEGTLHIQYIDIIY